MNPVKAFLQALQQPDQDIDVVKCALLIAAQLQPGLEIGSSFDQLDALAAEAAGEIASGEELLEFLYDQHRFRGNKNDYYRADNSFLNRVLETREGIPISLALVYIGVGQRLDLDVYGISFPGHFLVGVRNDGASEPVLLDVFEGRIVTREACYEIIARLYQRDVSPDQRYFAAAGNRRIVLRVLENLKAIYLRSGAATQALLCLDLQIITDPDNASLLEQQQGLLAHLRNGDSAPTVH